LTAESIRPPMCTCFTTSMTHKIHRLRLFTDSNCQNAV
jgi:hypothetical protein